jgi:hypothetical protein
MDASVMAMAEAFFLIVNKKELIFLRKKIFFKMYYLFSYNHFISSRKII